MACPSYVLVTPVRNEESTIGTTLEAVIHQTILPREWVVVSDASTDHTDEIVERYCANHKFIRLLRLGHRPRRSFSSVVFATESGLADLECSDYEFIGLLDGDIRLSRAYYQEILRRFAEDSRLGLAGGLVIDCYEGRRHKTHQSLRDVAGAVQFFRRQCFEAVRPLVALPEGGWDMLTCVQARRAGYRTRTFKELEVEHLKPRSAAEGGLLRRTWRLGMREYAVGSHPLFTIVKCGYRCVEYPWLLGGVVRLAGYLWCYLRFRRRLVAVETIKFIRREQLARLWSFGTHTASAR
jgi:glycosyltransferase involved in cell wall biosynthesis